jgi:hypothetical protein
MISGHIEAFVGFYLQCAQGRRILRDLAHMWMPNLCRYLSYSHPKVLLTLLL